MNCFNTETLIAERLTCLVTIGVLLGLVSASCLTSRISLELTHFHLLFTSKALLSYLGIPSVAILTFIVSFFSFLLKRYVVIMVLMMYFYLEAIFKYAFKVI